MSRTVRMIRKCVPIGMNLSEPTGRWVVATIEASLLRVGQMVSHFQRSNRKALTMKVSVNAGNAVTGNSYANVNAIVSKVPEVTLVFWIIKIAATTLGETGGDAVSMTEHLGYAVGSVIFIGIFVVAVAAQITAKSFHPFLYWAVIVATTTAGTTMADFADRSLGIGYSGGSSILFVLLMASLSIWYWSAGSVSVATITSPKVEMFYWVTILFSQTLGTALGDFLAASQTANPAGLGLGYEVGALVFGAGLALVAAAYFYMNVSHTLLFWAAFILTRPLGATLGDLLDKPLASGGLALSRLTASAVLAAFIVACILVLPQKAVQHPGGSPRSL